MPYLFCIITIFFFSTIELVGKLLGNSIDPLTYTSYRFFIGAIFILPFSLKYFRKEKTDLKGFLSMGWPGIIVVAVAMYLLQLSVFYGKALTAGVIVSSNPVFVPVFSFLILREKSGLIKILSIFISIIGLVLIMGKKVFEISSMDDPIKAILFAVGASLSFALYTVLSKKYIKEYDKYRFTVISFFTGALVLGLIGFLTGKRMLFDVEVRPLLILLYSGVFITGIAYLLYFKALEKIKAINASMFFFLKPVFVLFFSTVLLGEKINMMEISGVFLILISLIVSSERIFYGLKKF